VQLTQPQFGRPQELLWCDVKYKNGVSRYAGCTRLDLGWDVQQYTGGGAVVQTTGLPESEEIELAYNMQDRCFLVHKLLH
jgi:hypothetical protein